MKRILACVMVVGTILTMLNACGQNTEAQWQEQYDLGVRYLSEGNYEEAIIAFTAAIEIDPSAADALRGSWIIDTRTGRGTCASCRSQLP